MKNTYIIISALILIAFLSACSKRSSDGANATSAEKERSALQEYVHAPIDSAKAASQKSAEHDQEMKDQLDQLDGE